MSDFSDSDISALEFSAFLGQRRSVRAFLPEPVPRESIEAILSDARRAPSGANLQPGQFHVLTGDALAGLVSELLDAFDSNRPIVEEYSYFPDVMPKELKRRQIAAGVALYDALGIERLDKTARRNQFANNYRFFDAPVGIVVSIKRDMGKGCFMDMGMSLMSFFLSAQSRGLGSSGIGALANYADVVHRYLQLPEQEMVVCGIALGTADLSHPVNAVRTERENINAFSKFYGFID